MKSYWLKLIFIGYEPFQKRSFRNKILNLLKKFNSLKLYLFNQLKASSLKKLEAERDDLENLRRKTESSLSEEKVRNKDLASTVLEIRDELSKAKDRIADEENKHEIQVSVFLSFCLVTIKIYK